MPWVILAAALCVLVWFWPRNTLIGLAVVGTAGVLAGIAFVVLVAGAFLLGIRRLR